MNVDEWVKLVPNHGVVFVVGDVVDRLRHCLKQILISKKDVVSFGIAFNCFPERQLFDADWKNRIVPSLLCHDTVSREMLHRVAHLHNNARMFCVIDDFCLVKKERVYTELRQLLVKRVNVAASDFLLLLAFDCTDKVNQFRQKYFEELDHTSLTIIDTNRGTLLSIDYCKQYREQPASRGRLWAKSETEYRIDLEQRSTDYETAMVGSECVWQFSARFTQK